MQYDQKRIAGPESVPYQLNARRKIKSYEDKLAIVFAQGKRQDGRSFEESRKICKYIGGRRRNGIWLNSVKNKL